VNKKTVYFEILFSIYIGIFSYYISLFYTEGDQLAYRKIYEDISELSFVDAFSYYSSYMGVSEVVHFIVIWISTHLTVDKNITMAISNSLLWILAFKTLVKYNVNFYVSLVLTSFNFYMFVLFFAAERLKFGFIFLFLSVLAIDNGKSYLKYVSLSILSHVQMAIVYVSLAFSNENIYSIKKIKLLSFKTILLVLLFSGTIFFLYDHIIEKVSIYSRITEETPGYNSLSKLIVFAILAFIYKRKFETILMFVPLFISAFLLGSERINMLGYMAFLYYGLQYKTGLNVGVLATSSYFIFKAIIFLTTVFAVGNAFDPDWISINFEWLDF
jgi:hypothetical protein